MRFLIGLTLGLLAGGVLGILATGNAGQALQAQMRESEAERKSGREQGLTRSPS